MTQHPDDPNPEESGDGLTPGGSERPAGGGRKLDEDAAWRAIVEHYGERATLEDGATPTVDRPPEAPTETGDSWEEEAHFVPPDPPPVPAMEPRRKLAWLGLFGSPLLMLVAVVFGWRLWDWVLGVLVLGFVGGFVYLVATMPRRPPEDGSPDDGAVV